MFAIEEVVNIKRNKALQYNYPYYNDRYYFTINLSLT